LFVFSLIGTEAIASENWRKLDESIEHKEIYRHYSEGNKRTAKIHAVRVKQGQYQVSIRSFHDLKESERVSIFDLREKTNSLIVMSGGFFDPDYRSPVGLLIEDKKKIFEVSPKFSGVIWIKDSHLHLSPTRDFNSKSTAPDFAIQGYPRIVDPVNKLGINKQGGGLAQRAAVCTAEDNIIFFITDKYFDGISLYEFAKIAQQSEDVGGLGCDIAINLDGGPAPGISVSPELMNLNIKEGWQVPNVLVVDKK